MIGKQYLGSPLKGLLLQPLLAAGFPPVVHKETRLGDLDHDLVGSSYVFVANDVGSIVGLVRTLDIRERLQASNAEERARWAQMPLACLLTVTFPQHADFSAGSIAAVPESAVLIEGQEISGIATERDIYLSWSQLANVLCDAISDPLTGLPNRLIFERRLQEEWSRSRRVGNSIAVMILDVDHFKEINDRYGHAVGDAVLRAVAETFESSLRSYDLVVRFGGDEFTAICLGCRPGEIEIPIRRIQENLTARSFLIEGVDVRISVSIGAAVRHGGFLHAEAQELFTTADQCLYRAKDSRGAASYIELGLQTEERTPPGRNGQGEPSALPVDVFDDNVVSAQKLATSQEAGVMR